MIGCGALSLWDMIKSDVAHLAFSLGTLHKLQSLAEKTTVNEIDPALKQIVLDHYAMCRTEFSKYAMPTTLDRLRDAENFLTNVANYPNSSLATDCEEIGRCAQSELSRCYFGFIDADKAKEILTVGNLWSSVWEKFGSSKRDAREASFCYALGRNDAAVFHSMMVLERGLLALCRKLGIDPSARAWQGVITDLEKEVEKRQLALKAKKPSDMLTFLSAAAKEFTYFKDAWRNHTAHGRAEYDENDARKVLTHVREFMAHLATRLKDRKSDEFRK
jgi:HEPN domain-containing protein